MFINQTKNGVEINLKANLNMSRGAMVLFLVIVPLACIGGGIGLLFTQFSNAFSYALFIAAAVSFCFFAFCFKPLLKLFLKRAIPEEKEMIYTFTEESFSAQAEGESKMLKGGYGALKKCEEYKELWLIHTKNTIYPLRKDGMKQGTKEELSVFLQRKMQKNYKKKTRG